MLSTLLLMLVLGLVVGMVALGMGVGLVLRAVADRSRLHPSIETGAPLDWCWSPSAPARWHRRLQSALLPLDPPHPTRRRGCHDELTALVVTIAEQARTIDRELIQAARLRGPARRARLRQLRGEVVRVEQLSHRVQQQRARAGAATSPPRDDVFADVDSRLDLLAAAHAELTAIEQASTASDPDAVLRRLAPRPSAPVERARPARGIHRTDARHAGQPRD